MELIQKRMYTESTLRQIGMNPICQNPPSPEIMASAILAGVWKRHSIVIEVDPAAATWIGKLASDTGACVSTMPGAENSGLILISGTHEEIRHKVADIISTISIMQHHSIVIRVDPAAVGRIVGKEGLTTGTGATVSMMSKEMNSGLMLISGTMEQIRNAVDIIIDTIDMIQHHSIVIGVDPAAVGCIVGKEGLNMATDTGATVSMMLGAEKLGLIHISGTLEQIRHAADAIMQNSIPKLHHSIGIEVDPAAVGRIVGKEGVNIRKLETDTGATVRIMPKDANTDLVHISGTLKQIQHAADIIMQWRVEGLVLGRKDHFMVVGDVGLIAGNGGVIIEKLKVSYVSTPPMEDINRLTRISRSGLDAISTTIDERHSMDVEVNPVDVRWIVGKEGANIRKLETDTGATVRTMPKEMNSGQIRIFGTMEQIRHAVDIMNDTIDMIQWQEERLGFGGKDHFMNITRVGLISDKDGVTKKLKISDGNTIGQRHSIGIEVNPAAVGWIVGKEGVNIMKLETDTGATVRTMPKEMNSGQMHIFGTMEQIRHAVDIINDTIDTIQWHKEGLASGCKDRLMNRGDVGLITDKDEKKLKISDGNTLPTEDTNKHANMKKDQIVSLDAK